MRGNHSHNHIDHLERKDHFRLSTTQSHERRMSAAGGLYYTGTKYQVLYQAAGTQLTLTNSQMLQLVASRVMLCLFLFRVSLQVHNYNLVLFLLSPKSIVCVGSAMSANCFGYIQPTTENTMKSCAITCYTTKLQSAIAAKCALIDLELVSFS
jgi:hypothetical protein